MIIINTSRKFYLIKSSVRSTFGLTLWGYSTRSNNPQKSQTWLVPFGFLRLVKFEPIESEWFLGYNCRDLLQCSFRLNELDINHYKSLSYISSLFAPCLPFFSCLPCSSFILLFEGFKLQFYPFTSLGNRAKFLCLEHWWLFLSSSSLILLFWEITPKSVLVGFLLIEASFLRHIKSSSKVNVLRPIFKA